VLLTQNDVDASAASTQECLTLARQLGDPYLIARATGDLGMHMNITWECRPEIRTRDYMARAQALLEDCLARHAGLERAFVLDVSAMIELTWQNPVQAAGHLRDALPLHLGVGDVAGLCQALEWLTVVTGGDGDPARVVRLIAVSQQIRDLGQAEWNYPEHRSRIDEMIRSARGRLDKREYEAAYQQGWQMSLEEALAYAVDPQAQLSVPTPGKPQRPPDTQLTRRERQVADLVGQGMSNREIAGRLMISQRTAKTHVENILRKLGFTARAQIAAWISKNAGDATREDR
jgi:non-specific serine/threonine protein kinase